MSNRDSLYIQYQEIRAQMNGISPKLSIYKKLAEQLEDIKKQLGGMAAPSVKPKHQREKTKKKVYRAQYQQV